RSTCYSSLPSPPPLSTLFPYTTLFRSRTVFLRGTLDCAIFPLTGYPPTDHEGWEKVFGTAKAYGLNHIRYHSWCPPKAAFEVARSEEHTSELQSRENLVCRLLLEKKNH